MKSSPPLPSLRGHLRIISAGAAQSLVLSLGELINRSLPPASSTPSSPQLQLNASFGAVGAMVDLFEKERLEDGSPPCDLMISSQSILTDLGARGWLQANTIQPLGLVSTGLARVSSDESGLWGAGAASQDPNAHLAETFLQASQIYIPDPLKSTAGIHVKAVLTALGLWERCADKLQSFPNGATAMARMAQEARAGALGCTQKTEILFTPGVQWVEALPPDHALKTLYSVARVKADVSTHPDSANSSANKSSEERAQVALAQAFLDQLVSPEQALLRAESGFESVGLNQWV